MSCEKYMGRVKEAVADFYGSVPMANAPAANRGRSKTRAVKPETIAAQKAAIAEVKQQLIESGVNKPSAKNISRARSASRIAKLSPETAKIETELVPLKSEYAKLKKEFEKKGDSEVKKQMNEIEAKLRPLVIAKKKRGDAKKGGARRSRRASRASRASRKSRSRSSARKSRRASHRRRH